MNDLKFIHLEKIDSTNTYAKNLLDSSKNTSDVNKFVICAEEQTCGRGRMNRSFYSPAASGLYMSVIYCPKEFKSAAEYTATAAVCVCDVINELFGIETSIKWVNDIYLNSKKICGILAEGYINPKTQKIEAIIVGIGINLWTEDFPPEILEKAGSLHLKNVDKLNLAKKLATKLFENYDKDEFFQIIKEYRKKSNVIGKKVKISPVINQEQKDFEALVLDITDEAKLKVQTEKNEILFLESGEISTKII